MKKVVLFFLLLVLAVSAFASTPTVTISLTATTPKYFVYTATFATAIANADSAFVYSTGTTPFSIEEIGYQDSLIVVAFTTTETTADSARFTVLAQVSSLAAPTTGQYVTALTDATAFTNTTGGLFRFPIRRAAGLSRVLRFIVFENDTNKDATQTVTLVINIPRQ